MNRLESISNVCAAILPSVDLYMKNHMELISKNNFSEIKSRKLGVELKNFYGNINLVKTSDAFNKWGIKNYSFLIADDIVIDSSLDFLIGAQNAEILFNGKLRVFDYKDLESVSQRIESRKLVSGILGFNGANNYFSRLPNLKDFFYELWDFKNESTHASYKI